MDDLTNTRQKYAKEIRDALKRHFRLNLSNALLSAFATVPRERFLGQGPWLIRNPTSTLWQRWVCWVDRKDRTTDFHTADPKHLYRHNAIVAIDADRGLNNGQPSGLASWLHFLEINAGDRVLHVGCGVGYYTAIIAEVVGPTALISSLKISARSTTSPFAPMPPTIKTLPSGSIVAECQALGSRSRADNSPIAAIDVGPS